MMCYIIIVISFTIIIKGELKIMKRFKKSMSVLLAAIIAFSALSAMPFTASAAEVLADGTSANGYSNESDEDNFSYFHNDFGDILISGYSGTNTDIVIPDKINGYKVIGISYGAFENCSQIESITVPDGVTEIGPYAFNNCSELSNIYIPDSVTTDIGNNAFDGTKWLENQPDGVVYVGKTVYGYKGIMPENNSLIISGGTKSIADCAFENLENLNNISIPNSMENIGYNAFMGCLNIKSVTIPSGINEIGRHAFGYSGSYYDSDNWEFIYEKVDGFTIYGYAGTAAEDYAKENGFEFIELGDVAIGDLSGDGIIDINDATMIQKFGIGINTPEVGSELFTRADVNGDGRISILDVTCVQKYLVGGYKNTGLLGK